jgi:translation initiation factor 5B
MTIPGLLMIDTPRHASFANLPSHRSSICDLVVGIFSGLEKQTEESLCLLEQRGTPFIVALNRIDRLTRWAARRGLPTRARHESLRATTKHHFDERWSLVQAQLARRDISAELAWKARNIRETVSILPMSAMTDVGDLVAVLHQLSQLWIADQIRTHDGMFRCTALDVKPMEGVGTIVDVILVDGMLARGDQPVMGGFKHPVVTEVRNLQTPPPTRETRVKGDFTEHTAVSGAMGVRTVGTDLDVALAVSPVYKVGTINGIRQAQRGGGMAAEHAKKDQYCKLKWAISAICMSYT